MRRNFLLAVSIVIVGTPYGLAQYGGGLEDGIQGTGNITLERSADRMRMQVVLLAKSTKDLPDALSKLKAQRGKVEKQLQTLGVIKDSVKFGDPHVDTSQDDPNRRMQVMMRQRMNRQRGKKPEKEKEVKIVKLKMNLMADFPLKGADSTALLMESTKLQDAIKAADLGGLKEAEEPTAEEAEMEEEGEEPDFNYGNQNGPKPGEAQFIFLTRISDADLEKARSDAFKAARAEAGQLAKAADIQLGDLVRLGRSYGGGVDADDVDGDEYQAYYNRGFGQMLRRYQNREADEVAEAVGISPGKLKFRVGVMASFAIKSSGVTKPE